MSIDQPFAPMPRMLDYCKAINFHFRREVSTFIGHILSMSNRDIAESGYYEGVFYFHTTDTYSKPQMLLQKSIRQVKAFIIIYKYLSVHKKSIEVVHLQFGKDFRYLAIYWLICKVLKIPISRELAEFPFVDELVNNSYFRHGDSSLSHRISANIYRRLGNRLFDGVIAITTFLAGWAKDNSKRSLVTAKIPISVDTCKFSDSSQSTSPENGRCAYVGSLKYRDELDNLIRSFHLVHKENPSAILTILGDFTGLPKEKQIKWERLKSHLSELNIIGSVNLLGRVKHTNIPNILYDHDIMLLPRPFTLISKAGFPSKLGEYLAMGKPVVLTATGDIPVYLTDGVSACLVYSESVREFADKVTWLIRNPKEAKGIGARGRIIAEEHFSLPTIGRLLADYMQCLNRRK